MGSPTCGCRRILFVIGSLDMGGAEKQTVLLASHLTSLGFECSVFALRGEGILKSKLAEAEITVFSGGLQKHDLKKAPWKLLISFLKLIKTLQRLKPHIIHSFLPLATFLGALGGRLFRVPLVVSSRRALGTHQERIPIIRPLDYLAYKLSHRVTVNSRAVWDDLLKRDHVDPNKIALIYNGVPSADHQQAFPKERKHKHLRGALGIPQDQIVIICVANLIPYKGHQDLLQALAYLRSFTCQVTVLLIGEDRGIGKTLKDSAKKLGVDNLIQFLGQRSDVGELMRAGDLFVLPSHEEGFSNVILEAMAAGLPVIATHVGGNPEAVIHGKTGWLVPPRNPRDLAEKMLDLMADPAKSRRWGMRSRRRVQALFSMENMINSHLQLYRQSGS